MTVTFYLQESIKPIPALEWDDTSKMETVQIKEIEFGDWEDE